MLFVCKTSKICRRSTLSEMSMIKINIYENTLSYYACHLFLLKAAVITI